MQSTVSSFHFLSLRACLQVTVAINTSNEYVCGPATFEKAEGGKVARRATVCMYVWSCKTSNGSSWLYVKGRELRELPERAGDVRCNGTHKLTL